MNRFVTNSIIVAFATTAIAGATQAQQVLLFDPFAEFGRSTTLDAGSNPNFFSSFTVDGSVDYIRGPDFGINCSGGGFPNQCVDLAGTPSGPGRLTTRSVFGLGEFQRVTLSFEVSGNQRQGGTDSFFAGFTFSNPALVIGFTSTGFGTTDPSLQTVTSLRADGTVTGSAFNSYSITFISRSATGIRAFIGSDQLGAVGPVLDNVRLETSGLGVPEASTWAMMIAGFGLVGFAARRRRVALAA